MHSSFVPVVVVVLAAVAFATRRYAQRRRAAQKISGGRKSLVLNLIERR